MGFLDRAPRKPSWRKCIDIRKWMTERQPYLHLKKDIPGRDNGHGAFEEKKVIRVEKTGRKVWGRRKRREGILEREQDHVGPSGMILL